MAIPIHPARSGLRREFAFNKSGGRQPAVGNEIVVGQPAVSERTSTSDKVGDDNPDVRNKSGGRQPAVGNEIVMRQPSVSNEDGMRQPGVSNEIVVRQPGASNEDGIRQPAVLQIATAIVIVMLAVSVSCWQMVTVAQQKSDSPARPAIPRGFHQVELNGRRFTLPEGFTIELAAAPPLVMRPITIALDEAGRLYVGESSGSNERVTEQVKTRPHRILRLEDSDGDGRYDRVSVFVDRVMFPEGTLWLDGALYVAAPPQIWRFRDRDGDGVAEEREVWFDGKTLTGCANDLHGPYLGPDGWLYWCKGAWAEQSYARPDGRVWKSRAAHIFRTPPDRLRSAFPQVPGRYVEAVLSGGMDNPVDVAFLPNGERFLTTTFLTHPQAGLRDGLLHAVYGGVYGKDHEPIYSQPWTAPTLMPVLVHMGASASCGLTCYESEVFGAEYRGNLFACHFNLRKVTRHILVAHGAGYTTRDEDFLVCDHLDFHPTDVLEDADGSLLVVDTGGWYKLCCPTSQLPKPDVPGAIYRIRRRAGAGSPAGSGQPSFDDPRGEHIPWSQYTVRQRAELLGDPRPAVRQRASRSLVDAGPDAVAVLRDIVRQSTSSRQRLYAVWTLCQIPDKSAREAIRLALRDRDTDVQRAALHSVALWRDAEALAELSRLVTTADAAVRRVAAEALGRIGRAEAVPHLLQALADSANDRILQHSLTYALIEIGDARATAAGLKFSHPTVIRQTLVALDQMPLGPRGSESAIDQEMLLNHVLAALDAADASLRETAWWIASRHPEWGERLTQHIARQLQHATTSAQEEEWVRILTRLARSQAVQRLLAELLSNAEVPIAKRRLLLRVMAESGLREAPSVWVQAWLDWLRNPQGQSLWPEVLTALRRVPPGKADFPKVTPALLAVGERRDLPAEIRLRALAAIPGRVSVSDEAMTLALQHLPAHQPVILRGLAVEFLLRAQLNSSQLQQLARIIPQCSPLEADRLLEVFAAHREDAVGETLLANLERAEIRASLRPASIRRAVSQCSPAVQRRAEKLIAELDAATSQQKQKLEQLLAALKPGDVRRGQQVFQSAKAACSACHTIGYLGGRIGPDLTRIGALRSERDLLESIVFPSASFVQSYEPVLVATRDGRVYNGLIREDRPEDILLVTGPDQQIRIARQDIEAIQPSKVSIMPSGFDQQLTLEELSDLIAFLKSCK